MSTDGSRDIAKEFGATIFDVQEGSFDHGLTRNAGVNCALGELIFLTVQDAWAASDDLLEKMAGHFADPEVMAVTGHQAVPHEKDMNPVLWYRPVSQPQTTIKETTGREAFERLSAAQQQALISWDNVVAMYRRAGLVEQPFIATEFAEDRVWSYQAILRGWKLLHDSSLVMYHYHHPSYSYVFRATYTLNYHLHKYFKLVPALPAAVNPLAKATYHLFKNRELSSREKIYWTAQNCIEKLAIYFSTINFLVRLKSGGGKKIDRGYQRYCRVIPQGRQKS